MCKSCFNQLDSESRNNKYENVCKDLIGREKSWEFVFCFEK